MIQITWLMKKIILHLQNQFSYYCMDCNPIRNPLSVWKWRVQYYTTVRRMIVNVTVLIFVVVLVYQMTQWVAIIWDIPMMSNII